MNHCEWWIPEVKIECGSTPEFILDCGNCKNALVCSTHAGVMMLEHFKKCEMVLHVEPLEMSHGQ